MKVLSIYEKTPKFASDWIKDHPNLWMYPKDGKSKINFGDICRALTGTFRINPDFIIIGVQKGGTTSLSNYLIQHPSIHPALHKEIHFFDRHFERGLNWYKANFPTQFQKYIFKNLQNKEFLTGEATPDYIFHEFVPNHIRKELPNVKLVVTLRNPVDRAYSHYNMRVSTGDEKLSFEQALTKENERIIKGGHDLVLFSYRKRGLYAEQLLNWMNYFPKEQFFIVEINELEKNPQVVYNEICNFLNIKKIKLNFKKHHVGKYKEKMKSETRKSLLEFFKPHNEKLYKLLGRNFMWEN